jgi:hypothetical protein
MKLKEYILKTDYSFWEKGGKILYTAGSKLLVEEEEMMSIDPQVEYKYYYVYSKPKSLLGYYDKEEFFEIFMTLEEARDKKIGDII